MKGGAMKGLAYLFVVVIACICTGDPQIVLTLDAPDTNISGLGYGAGSLWAVDKTTEFVYRIDPANGTVLDSWYFAANGTKVPAGLAFANNTIYLTGGNPPNLTLTYGYRYNTSGTYLGSFSMDC